MNEVDGVIYRLPSATRFPATSRLSAPPALSFTLRILRSRSLAYVSRHHLIFPCSPRSYSLPALLFTPLWPRVPLRSLYFPSGFIPYPRLPFLLWIFGVLIISVFVPLDISILSIAVGLRPNVVYKPARTLAIFPQFVID